VGRGIVPKAKKAWYIHKLPAGSEELVELTLTIFNIPHYFVSRIRHTAMQRFLHTASLLLICLLAVQFRVTAQTMTPLQLNNELVAITDQVQQKGQDWGKSFNESFKLKDFSLLTPVRKELETLVDQQMANVKAMKDVNNSKALRQAMIDYLLFKKTMIAKGYKPIEALRKDPDQDKLKAAFENMKAFSPQEDEALKKLTKAREVYATANGFKIEKAETIFDEDD
jgi:hypothetical protein